MAIIITGGAGFIGSNFIRAVIDKLNEDVVNVDKLTYAGNLNNLEDVAGRSNYKFHKGDISDGSFIGDLIDEYAPRAIINFAAESHVDRSITRSNDFVETNIVGTHTLLECTRKFLLDGAHSAIKNFRFVQISTDEVFGELSVSDNAVVESDRYKPRNPYSASKAAADHLVRSYYSTYGVPILITHSSNNYGPRQYPEKLIPLVISRASKGLNIPIYGDGRQVRDWIYVEDNCKAIKSVLDMGLPGQSYNIGATNELTNIEIVGLICEIVDELQGNKKDQSCKNLIEFVTDRPGHDRRYAIDPSKIKNELGWETQHEFVESLRTTVQWYID